LARRRAVTASRHGAGPGGAGHDALGDGFGDAAPRRYIAEPRPSLAGDAQRGDLPLLHRPPERDRDRRLVAAAGAAAGAPGLRDPARGDRGGQLALLPARPGAGLAAAADRARHRDADARPPGQDDPSGQAELGILAPAPAPAPAATRLER